MSVQTLIKDNIETLRSALTVIHDLNDEQYTAVLSPYFSASVGKHIRHILDHYTSFLDGWEQRQINYDARQRDTRIETERLVATAHIEAIIQQLESLSAGARPETVLSVALCTSVEQVDCQPVSSSLTREIVFLHGHTTHHYALIAAILRFLEFPIIDGFGTAPSTLVYEKQQVQCAP